MSRPLQDAKVVNCGELFLKVKTKGKKQFLLHASFTVSKMIVKKFPGDDKVKLKLICFFFFCFAAKKREPKEVSTSGSDSDSHSGKAKKKKKSKKR